jgi:hypothetical protein
MSDHRPSHHAPDHLLLVGRHPPQPEEDQRLAAGAWHATPRIAPIHVHTARVRRRADAIALADEPRVAAALAPGPWLVGGHLQHVIHSVEHRRKPDMPRPVAAPTAPAGRWSPWTVDARRRPGVQSPIMASRRLYLATSGLLAVVVLAACGDDAPVRARYLGVAYDMGKLDDGWYWRMTPASGQTRYLDGPGTGRGLPARWAAEAAAQSFIVRQKLSASPSQVHA